MAQFSELKGLQDWLRGKSVDWHRVLAVRCALRMLPFVEELKANNHFSQRIRRDVLLAIFRAFALPWAAIDDAKFVMGDTVEAADAAGIDTKIALSSIERSYSAFEKIAIAVADAVTTSFDGVSVIVEIVDISTAYLAEHFGTTEVREYWAALARDADALVDGVVHSILNRRPLWHGEIKRGSRKAKAELVSALVDSEWNSFKTGLVVGAAQQIERKSWSFWTDWYEGILFSEALPWSSAARSILTETSLWLDADPAAINRALQVAQGGSSKETGARFIVKETSNGQYDFRLTVGNDLHILRSDTYKTVDAADAAIESVKRNGKEAKNYERLEAKNGLFYFNLKNEKRQVIGTSGLYKIKDFRDVDIDSLIEIFRLAEIDENKPLSVTAQQPSKAFLLLSNSFLLATGRFP